MRVITGTAKGRRLDTLEGMDVRPTADRVKEGMFSSIQFEIENALVLDLFGGSGQLGIEALSRGARAAVFVDNSKKSIDIIKSNLRKTGFEEKSLVFNMNSEDFLRITDKKFDFVFLDPPYNKGIIEKTIPLLSGKINNNGKIFCEHEKKLILPDEINEFRLKKNYKYGKIEVTLYSADRKDD